MGSTGRSRLAGLLGLNSQGLHLLSICSIQRLQAIDLGELSFANLLPMSGHLR